MSVEPALTLEYRLTQHMMAAHDFYEGVRAALIDKDQTPRWRPASFAEIGAEMVELISSRSATASWALTIRMRRYTPTRAACRVISKRYASDILIGRLQTNAG